MTRSRVYRTVVVGCLASCVVAVVILSVALLWPAFQAYQERIAIEPDLKRVTMANRVEIERLLKPDIARGFRVVDPPYGEQDIKVTLFSRKFYWYCLVQRVDRISPKGGGVVVGVESYRLEKPASPYTPQTERGRDARKSESSSFFRVPLGGPFLADFVEVLTGAAPPDVRMHYQLIHSDHVPDREATRRAAMAHFGVMPAAPLER